eukprot:g2561.t1
MSAKKTRKFIESTPAPVTPDVSKRSRRIVGSPSSPSSAVEETQLPDQLQKLLEFQDTLMLEASTPYILQYFNLDEIQKTPQLLQEDLDNIGIILRLMPDGRLHYFGLEGWSPLPSLVDDPEPQMKKSPSAKKKKSRAHVLKPGALSLIPYGVDERVTWTKRIFHFIGKMRKVLGDRSLGSPWGGSVIDSIIGVYLTQNVSDTFSSKAFMNIAAKFPSPYYKQGLSLEWMRDLDYDSIADLLTSRLEGFGEKSAACVTLLALHLKCFPVDVNVARICARLGWVPLKTTEKIEDLDLYAPDLEVHKYLKKRLLHLDFEVLYELHYQMITMGKVFCTKRNPRCGQCPLKSKCEYALNGGKKFEEILTNNKKKLKANDDDISPKTPLKEEMPLVDVEEVIPWNPESTPRQSQGEMEVTRIVNLVESNSSWKTNEDRTSSLSRELALQILSIGKSCHSLRQQYKKCSKLIHPDKCRHPQADLAFSLLNVAYHLLMQDDESPYQSSSESESETFVDLKQLPLTIRAPMTWSRTRNVLDGFLILDQNILPPCIPISVSGMVLLPDPRYYSTAKLPKDFTKVDGNEHWEVFALVPAKEALNHRFPLNGTFFQINELFFVDHVSFSTPICLFFHEKEWMLKKFNIYSIAPSFALEVLTLKLDFHQVCTVF